MNDFDKRYQDMFQIGVTPEMLGVKEMTPKEQAFKMIEGRIESIQKLSIECIEFIYIAAYNEAINDCLANMNSDNYIIAETIRKLKR